MIVTPIMFSKKLRVYFIGSVKMFEKQAFFFKRLPLNHRSMECSNQAFQLIKLECI